MQLSLLNFFFLILGYEMQDRHVGFDLATTKVVLTDIAIQHATALALKLLEPEIFKNEIKKQCVDYGRPTAPPKGDDTAPQQGLPNLLPILTEYVKTNNELSHIHTAFKKFADRMEGEREKIFRNRLPKEPFCTLLHTDLWVNNIMPKIQDRVVVGNILVDFQMCRIGSPAEDLLFFLFSSVQSLVLKTEFDNLITYYYDVFSEVLKKYDCYGPQFSYDQFLEELRENAYRPIDKCTFMLPLVVFNKKGNKFDMNRSKLKLEDLPDLAKERINILLLEAYKRKWIV